MLSVNYSLQDAKHTWLRSSAKQPKESLKSINKTICFADVERMKNVWCGSKIRETEEKLKYWDLFALLILLSLHSILFFLLFGFGFSTVQRVSCAVRSSQMDFTRWFIFQCGKSLIFMNFFGKKKEQLMHCQSFFTSVTFLYSFSFVFSQPRTSFGFFVFFTHTFILMQWLKSFSFDLKRYRSMAYSIMLYNNLKRQKKKPSEHLLILALPKFFVF